MSKYLIDTETMTVTTISAEQPVEEVPAGYVFMPVTGHVLPEATDAAVYPSLWQYIWSTASKTGAVAFGMLRINDYANPRWSQDELRDRANWPTVADSYANQEKYGAKFFDDLGHPLDVRGDPIIGGPDFGPGAKK